MWNKLITWLQSIFFRDVESPQLDTVPEYVLPDEWIFDGPRPTNMVIHKLYTGMSTLDDHIVYRSQDTGRIAGSITEGNDTWIVKQLSYWISVGVLLPGHTFNSMRSTCGMQKCIHPDHLTPKYNPSKKIKTPPKSKQPKVVASRVTGPPEYTVAASKNTRSAEKDKLLNGDRTKCPSAKVYYPDAVAAKSVASQFNRKFREKNGRKLYGYKCDWCGGGHLTKQNPETRPVHKHKGSWS